MSNLKNAIMLEAEGKDVIAVIIGRMGWNDYGSENVPSYQQQPKNVILSWEEAIPWIDYKFPDSYAGHTGCNAIYAWTEEKVIFISQYDGSTTVCSVPRNPTACEPHMPGG